MGNKILTLLAIGALFISGAGIASAQHIPHFPSERHVFAEEIKEDIRELRDLVNDLRDVLREVRKNR